MSDWKLELYNLVSDAVGRRPKESIMNAAYRVKRAGVLGQAWSVASVVIRNRDARGAAAWDSLRRAAIKGRLRAAKCGEVT